MCLHLCVHFPRVDFFSAFAMAAYSAGERARELFKKIACKSARNEAQINFNFSVQTTHREMVEEEKEQGRGGCTD